MVVSSTDLQTLATELRTKAETVEQNASDHDMISAMQHVQNEAREVAQIAHDQGNQQGLTLVDEDLAEMLQGTAIAKHQQRLSEQLANLMATGNFPTRGNVKRPFEEVLQLAKQLEEQLAELGVGNRLLENA